MQISGFSQYPDFEIICIQSTSENRTFGFQTTLKSERSAVWYGLVRISNVRDQSYTVRYSKVPISVIRGFGTNCLKSERSDFSHAGIWYQLSEIRMFRLFHRILILLTFYVEIYESDFCLLSLVFPSRQTNKCK